VVCNLICDGMIDIPCKNITVFECCTAKNTSMSGVLHHSFEHYSSGYKHLSVTWTFTQFKEAYYKQQPYFCWWKLPGEFQCQ